VTADLRLIEPRYASLPNIMKAKKKPLEEIDAAEFGIALEPRILVVKSAEPEERQAGVRVGSVAEVVDKLRKEAGVLQ
jgi:electron transfer flavoprotein beta subunit